MENKSIGGALVEVFDAVVSLIKSEITAITRRMGNIAKAKGLGVVLLLGSLVPLTLALVFLILFVFYGLERLGLGAWAAALIMGIVSLIVTAGLVFVALKRLGSDVPDDSEPNTPLSDIQKDDLKYGAAKPSGPAPATPAPAPAVSPSTGGSTSTSTAASGAPVQSWQAHTPAAGTGHTTGGHPAPPAGPSETRGGLQSTSTQGKASAESEQNGIPVTTNPTYSDDMKKEGY